MKTALLAILCLPVLLGLPRHGWGEPPRVTVVAADGASVPPAVVAELLAETESRVGGLAAAPGAVRIRLDDTGATIEVDGKRRRVGVSDWADPAAARFILVHVIDLAAPAPEVAALALAPVATEVRAPAPAPADPPAALAYVSPLLSHGIGAADPYAPGVEAGAVMVRGRLLLGASLGWTRGLERGQGTPTEARYDLWPLRLSVGWRLGALELVASGLVAAYRFSGVNRSTGVRPGAGGAVRWQGRFGRRIGWFAAAGIDGFAHRVELIVADRTVYSTPRLAPSVGLGVTWRLP